MLKVMPRCFVLAALQALVLWAQIPVSDAAQQARDRWDVQALQDEIWKQERKTTQKPTLENYVRLARLQDWMCEAAYGQQNRELVKQAAEAGVAAAEKAVQLDAKSSEAHRLLGHLLSNLIPHVFGGGMRYGQRAVDEVEMALKLDPRNVEAYISRAISYHFTPAMFGGSEEKAAEMLHKALEINPYSDSARIWLAQVYHKIKRPEDAVREIREARRLNPERKYAEYVEMLVTGKLPD